MRIKQNDEIKLTINDFNWLDFFSKEEGTETQSTYIMEDAEWRVAHCLTICIVCSEKRLSPMAQCARAEGDRERA